MRYDYDSWYLYINIYSIVILLYVRETCNLRCRYCDYHYIILFVHIWSILWPDASIHFRAIITICNHITCSVMMPHCSRCLMPLWLFLLLLIFLYIIHMMIVYNSLPTFITLMHYLCDYDLMMTIVCGSLLYFCWWLMMPDYDTLLPMEVYSDIDDILCDVHHFWLYTLFIDIVTWCQWYHCTIYDICDTFNEASDTIIYPFIMMYITFCLLHLFIRDTLFHCWHCLFIVFLLHWWYIDDDVVQSILWYRYVIPFISVIYKLWVFYLMIKYYDAVMPAWPTFWCIVLVTIHVMIQVMFFTPTYLVSTLRWSDLIYTVMMWCLLHFCWHYIACTAYY